MILPIYYNFLPLTQSFSQKLFEVVSLSILPTIVVTAFLFVVFVIVSLVSQPTWPEPSDTAIYPKVVRTAKETYAEKGFNYEHCILDYSTEGSYFHIQYTKEYTEDRFDFDDDGIPQVIIGEDLYYNPVTTAQHALYKHDQYLSGDKKVYADFIKAVRKLEDSQDNDGALRYWYKYPSYIKHRSLEPGWVSAMAQGQALSVYARAFTLTKDPEYLEVGNKAFAFLQTPSEEGGTKTSMKDLNPTLDEYVFYEEYVYSPSVYTLNGFMFTLIGIYDWKVVTETVSPGMSNAAQKAWDEGIETLSHILTYYDIEGISAYDLSYLTYNRRPLINPKYHMVHICQLNAIYQLTDVEIFAEYRDKWIHTAKEISLDSGAAEHQ